MLVNGSLHFSSCPSDGTLAKFSANAFEGSARAALERHIDECPRCQRKLAALATGTAATVGGLTVILPDQQPAPEIPGFLIERELGRGATSVVYQARELRVGRGVALKLVRTNPTADSNVIARWLHEASAASKVRHDNVVRLYQVGETEGWHYLVFELVPGGTLQDVLATPYRPVDAARLLATIADAVAAIHREGMLHLDLKPSNILLDRRNDTPRERATPRVGDFGVAARWNDPDLTTTLGGNAGPVGTPRYMAPEQIIGDRRRLGPAADVYGLGAILYHVLTGRPPFMAASIAAIFEQIRTQEPVPLRQLDPSLPADLETICLKCLQKEPTKRYHSAEAMGDDLRRWLDGRPITARPASTLERAWRGCRRHPTVTTLAASLAGSLCLAFLGLFFLWRHAESQRVTAEADFQLSGELLQKIVTINTHGDYLQTFNDSDKITANLREIRLKLLSATARRPNHGTLIRHLAFVDCQLGSALMHRIELDEARTVLTESLSFGEKIISENPLDKDLRINQLLAMRGCAQIAEKEGNCAMAEAYLWRAATAACELERIGVTAESIGPVADSRQNLACFLARKGDKQGARLLLLANERMLDSAANDLPHHEVIAWRLNTRAKLASDHFRDESAVAPDAAANKSSLGAPLEGRAWAEQWLRSAVSELSVRGNAESSNPAIADAGFRFALHLAATAAEERRVKKLADAERTALRIQWLASLLIDRFPRHPAAHLTQAEAFVQVSKNAYQRDDCPLAERSLSQSLECTLQALVFDPKHEMARYLVDMRRRRVAGFMAAR